MKPINVDIHVEYVVFFIFFCLILIFHSCIYWEKKKGSERKTENDWYKCKLYISVYIAGLVKLAYAKIISERKKKNVMKVKEENVKDQENKRKK